MMMDSYVSCFLLSIDHTRCPTVLELSSWYNLCYHLKQPCQPLRRLAMAISPTCDRTAMVTAAIETSRALLSSSRVFKVCAGANRKERPHYSMEAAMSIGKFCSTDTRDLSHLRIALGYESSMRTALSPFHRLRRKSQATSTRPEGF